jgi:hypothetical protein
MFISRDAKQPGLYPAQDDLVAVPRNCIWRGGKDLGHNQNKRDGLLRVQAISFQEEEEKFE